MATVRVFHNINRDASFGFNTVFRKGPVAPEGVTSIELSEGGFIWKNMSDGPQERHELVHVFDYDYDLVGSDTPDTVLEEAFRIFNVGTGGLAQSYRARKLRSLSVGDVVMVDGQAYACESAGWKPVSKDDLRILVAHEADKVIRDRYEFGATEELAVTVPMPGTRAEDRARVLADRLEEAGFRIEYRITHHEAKYYSDGGVMFPARVVVGVSAHGPHTFDDSYGYTFISRLPAQGHRASTCFAGASKIRPFARKNRMIQKLSLKQLRWAVSSELDYARFRASKEA